MLATGPWDPAPWAAEVRKADPGRPVFVHPDVPDRAEIAYALLWKPPANALHGLTNLAAIFSLGAGVDHIVGLPLPDVPIARIVSPDLTRRMTEWVVLQVIAHHRRQRAYDRQQRAHAWRELGQPASGAVRVGIMGLGVLGRDAADALSRFAFDLAGWSRRPASIEGVRCFHGEEGLGPFLARTDILVALLPLTPETRGILSMPLFERLRRDGPLGGPVLINAGRGGLQVEADIVAALDRGILAGASLDVFETEPLDPKSPLWDYDNVVITPHAAGWSDPAVLVRQIVGQIHAFERGEPLAHLIDRKANY